MISNNGVVCGGTASPSHEKPKKAALRDVQNETAGSQSNGDAVKLSRTKRLIPDRPLSSQGTVPSCNGINENILNANRRFDLELGRGRLQNSVERFSESTKKLGQVRMGIPPQSATQLKDNNNNNLRHAPATTPSNATTTTAVSVPSSVGKQHAAKFSPKVEHSNADRYICLQNFLKQCDESNNPDYIKMLLQMPSTELSRFAIDLERRAIDLAVEEGNEMKRVKALNVLAKSSSSPTPQSAGK